MPLSVLPWEMFLQHFPLWDDPACQALCGAPREDTKVPDKGCAGRAQVSWSSGANVLKCFQGQLHEQQDCPCRDLWLPAQGLIPDSLRTTDVFICFHGVLVHVLRGPRSWSHRGASFQRGRDLA